MHHTAQPQFGVICFNRASSNLARRVIVPGSGILSHKGATMRRIALSLTLTTVTLLFAQSSSSYRIIHTYTLGAEGSWDYIVPDPPNHRLFIARQNRVMVVDEDNGTLLGEVTGDRKSTRLNSSHLGTSYHVF